MTGRSIRIVAVLALLIAAPASAEPAGDSVEYRWLSFFGNPEQPLPELRSPGWPQRSAIETILDRAFLALEADRGMAEPGYSTAYFRQPDPEFGKSVALQRPRQARLSFRFRF
jgi:hypothetical protein